MPDTYAPFECVGIGHFSFWDSTMYHHRQQAINFRNSPWPQSGGFLHSLVSKTSYNNINIGELFEYLADALYTTVGALNDSVDFTLINVCSPFTGFSHGSVPAPDVLFRPKGKALVFTFAIRSIRSYYGVVPHGSKVHRNSNAITKWGLDYQCRDFVSVSVDMVQAEEWAVTACKMYELQYIYNLIGAMTKSLIQHRVLYRADDESYDDLQSMVDNRQLYSRLYRMPLKQLFTTIPYHLWPFNYHVWEYCPNVLPQRLITPQVALYFFMYLQSIRNNELSVLGDLRMKRIGGILQMLTKSLLNMVQEVKTPTNDRNVDDIDLLAPAVLSRFIQNGTPQMDTGFGWRERAEEDRLNLTIDLQQSQNDLGPIFLPADQTARKILYADLNWRNSLLNSSSQ